MRLTRGIEVNEETLGFDTIRDVCMGGDGHYLGSDQTLKVMQTEYIYPNFSDRTSPNEWEENNKPILLQSAITKKNEILGSHFPAHISEETDEIVRANFPIFLPAESFRPG
jgi:trimethylamine--corrinoid protein Co-methyltransferase